MISNANGTAAYTYIQYDFRALNGGSNDSNYYLNFTIGDSTMNTSGTCVSDATTYTNGHCSESRFAEGLIGRALINSPGDTLKGLGDTATSALTDTDALRINVELNSISGDALGDSIAAGSSIPITMDIVTFGQSNDGVTAGDRHNNSIYSL
jgi:V8-like Glu-specific endopeptidase